MSCTEFHTGKLIPIVLESTLLAECIHIAMDNGLEFDKDASEFDILENFKDYFDRSSAKKHNRDEYIILNDKLYKVKDHYYAWDDEQSFARLFNNSDGSISFITQFYNGGTDFREMISDELDKI